MPSLRPRRSASGFTLVELVVVLIIIGVLAAVAIPRFISLGREARVASLNTMSGALWTAANTVHAACRLNPACDYNSLVQTIVIGGRSADVDFGWPNAGDNLRGNQIDIWVTYQGFTASLPDALHTRFALDGAPDPGHCSVTYEEASFNPARVPTITSDTSGC